MNGGRKMYPLSYHEPEKNNSTNSDLQSLLVSSVRCDTTDERPIRGQGSIVRRNVQSNVVVEQGWHCGCEDKIEAMTNTIKILSLTMHELQTKINICFTKQAAMQTDIGQNICKIQENGHLLWEFDHKQKQDSEMIVKIGEQSKMRMRELEDQLRNVRRTLSRFDSKDNERCPSSKLVQFKLQKFRGEQESKMAKLLQTVQEIGSLQRKMIAHTQKPKEVTFPDDESFIMPYSVSTNRPLKILKGSSLGKTRACESTNISYSRNTDTKS